MNGWMVVVVELGDGRGYTIDVGFGVSRVLCNMLVLLVVVVVVGFRH